MRLDNFDLGNCHALGNLDRRWSCYSPPVLDITRFFPRICTFFAFHFLPLMMLLSSVRGFDELRRFSVSSVSLC